MSERMCGIERPRGSHSSESSVQNSHANKDDGDCVEELLIFSDVNHHRVIEKSFPFVTVTANNTNNIK